MTVDSSRRQRLDRSEALQVSDLAPDLRPQNVPDPVTISRPRRRRRRASFSCRFGSRPLGLARAVSTLFGWEMREYLLNGLVEFLGVLLGLVR